jgi:ribosome maturation factor RimP
MDNDATLGVLKSILEGVLVNEPSYFLVEIRIKPTNNIKVFLDGDSGITIETCVRFNRLLYKRIEEANIFPAGDFSLEISSPGLDEPLKLIRQYKKNIGRKAEIILQDGIKKEGRLIEVSEDGIILEEAVGKNRNRQLINHTFLFNNIKTTRIQTVF